jgi:hypothetical protein
VQPSISQSPKFKLLQQRAREYIQQSYFLVKRHIPSSNTCSALEFDRFNARSTQTSCSARLSLAVIGEATHLNYGRAGRVDSELNVGGDGEGVAILLVMRK